MDRLKRQDSLVTSMVLTELSQYPIDMSVCLLQILFVEEGVRLFFRLRLVCQYRAAPRLTPHRWAVSKLKIRQKKLVA